MVILTLVSGFIAFLPPLEHDGMSLQSTYECTFIREREERERESWLQTTVDPFAHPPIRLMSSVRGHGLALSGWRISD